MSDERPENCTRCKHRFGERDGWTTVYQDGVPAEFLCWRCDQSEALANYRKTGTITTRLMAEASLCKLYVTECQSQLSRLRPEVLAFYQDNRAELLAIAAAVETIHARGRDFEVRHWLGAIQSYYASSPVRGHGATLPGMKVLLWGSAGRVLLTLQGEAGETYGGARITLIFDETAEYARGGIQGLCATRDEALAMLDAVIIQCPAFVPDGEVTLAGL